MKKLNQIRMNFFLVFQKNGVRKILITLIFIINTLHVLAQNTRKENSNKVLKITDTNFIYVGIPNKFLLGKKFIRLTVKFHQKGIYSKISDTELIVSPMHEGVFIANTKYRSKSYKILFIAKRLPDTE